MTNQTLIQLPMKKAKKVNKVKDLTFRVAFYKTTRASEASGASEAGQVNQPVRVKQAMAGGLN